MLSIASATCCRRRGFERTVVAVLGIVIASWGIGAQAVAWPSLDGEKIGILLHIEEHPALGPSFVKRINLRVDRMMWTLLGSDATIVTLDLPEFDAWLDSNNLEALTVEQCTKFGLADVEKTIVLDLRFSGNTYKLAAVEYDERFNTLSDPRRIDVLQRSTVPDSLGRLAMQSWNAVGIVRMKRGESYEVAFKDHAHLASLPQWSRLRRGQPLELFREIRQSDGQITRKSRDDQFLIVKKITANSVTATIAINAEQETWFQHLGHPQARYIVRILESESGLSAVRVVLDDTRQARQGCKVFLSHDRPKSENDLGEQQGITDYDGHAEFLVDSESVVYVSIIYGRSRFTKPFVRRPGGGPLEFMVPRRVDSTALESDLVAFEDQLRDIATKANTIHAEISQAATAGDTAKVERLTKAALRLTDTSSLRKDLTRLRTRASGNMNKGFNAKGLLDELEREVDKIESSVSQIQKDYKHSQQLARLQAIRQQIETAWQSYQWNEVERLCEASLEIDPTDKEIQALLDKLRKGLGSKNPQHHAAQQVVQQASDIATIDEFLGLWLELNRALVTLVRNQDELMLAQTKQNVVKWKQLIHAEVQRVQDRSANNQTLSQREITTLQVRIDDLKRVSGELLQTDARINALLTPDPP